MPQPSRVSAHQHRHPGVGRAELRGHLGLIRTWELRGSKREGVTAIAGNFRGETPEVAGVNAKVGDLVTSLAPRHNTQHLQLKGGRCISAHSLQSFQSTVCWL